MSTLSLELCPFSILSDNAISEIVAGTFDGLAALSTL